jgi:hypothetical protein
MKIDLDDGEVNTILVALKTYLVLSRQEQDREEADSAELCWQKISTVRQEYYNSIADPTGEGKTNNPINTSVDPFGLPTWSDT